MKQTQKGFTFLEVIIAVFILSMLIIGLAALVTYYFKNYSFSLEENQSVGQAQSALTRMIREIREARMGEDGSWPIIQTDDNTFIFYSDVTNDGRSDKVRYFIDGTTLNKGVIEPTSPPVTYPDANEHIYQITTNIDISGGPVFRYYNGNWPQDTINNPLSPDNRLLNTKYVLVYLKININPNSGATPFELSSGVSIRSVKTNL